jgi:hypothetical protein
MLAKRVFWGSKKGDLMPTKLRRYSVSFPDDLLLLLEQAAARYHMPFSRMVIFLCVRGLDYEKRFELSKASNDLEASRSNQAVPSASVVNQR